jgi:hypothetical protein
MTEPHVPTKAEQLAALDMYLKALKPIAEALRAEVAKEMDSNHDERKGAYLPDGTKIASVTLNDGRRSARVTDEAKAVAWCMKHYPGEVETLYAIRPAFLSTILAASKDAGTGLDPRTGEALPFVEVSTGDKFVSIHPTDDGTASVLRLAHDFPEMIEARR